MRKSRRVQRHRTQGKFYKYEDSEILALLDMETSPGEIFGEVSQSLAFVKELTWR